MTGKHRIPLVRAAARKAAARTSLLLSASAFLCVLLCSSSARAGTVSNDRPLLFSFNGADSSVGVFTYPSGIAVDEENGDVYVVNLAGHGKGEGPEQEPARRAVCKFDAEGKAQNFSTTGKSCLAGGDTSLGHAFGVEGFFEEGAFFSGVAVDNSGGSGGAGEGEQGRLYVSEEGGPIHAFTPSGEFLWTLGTGQAQPCGIAVDGEGHLWVGNGDAEGGAREKVLEFASSGSPPAKIGEFNLTHGELRRACSLAVSDSGEGVYLGGPSSFGTSFTFFVDKYVNGLYDSTVQSSGSSVVGLATSQSSASDLFTLAGDNVFREFELCATSGCGGTEVPGSPFGGEVLSSSHFGIGYDPAQDWVYVSDRTSKSVKVFGPPTSGTVPDVSCLEAGEITHTEATAHCTINPLGLPNAYRFEYRRCTSDGCDSSGEDWGAAKPACEGSAPEDSSNHQLSCRLEGLERNTSYEVRLVGTNTEAGKNLISAYSEPTDFKTLPPPPPTVEGCSISAITASSGHLGGCQVDPQEDETRWRVLRAADLGATLSQCEALAESTFSLVEEGTIPAKEPDEIVEVSADLTGLLPAQTNCVRVIATDHDPQPGVDNTVFRTEAVAPSDLETAFTAPRTDTTARVNARVDPEGEAPLSYVFEISEDGSNWTALPAQESTVAAWEPIVIADELTGLVPDTTYHYRIASAGNEKGSVPGPGEERTFTTRSSAEMALPVNALGEAEKRGIELVNSPEDGNQNVHMNGTAYGEGHGLVTGAGERAVWEVFSGAPGAPNAAENDFLAQRTTSGWTSQPLAPPASQQFGGGGISPNVFATTPDLSRFLALYGGEAESALARFDTSRNQQLLGVYPPNTLSSQATDLTDDGAHVLVQDEASGQIEDLGTGSAEVVSIMPDGSDSECGMEGEGQSFVGSANGGGGAGLYWRYGYHNIAVTDGSRAYFQAKPNGSGCGANVPLALYERNREAATTTLIDPGSGANEPHFVRATPDGHEAFFVTKGHCAKYDQATSGCDSEAKGDTNGHPDVYRWQETKSKASCLTCEVENEAGETISDVHLSEGKQRVAISNDFSHVYFESEAALDPGAAAGLPNIYALSGGVVHFVASVGSGGGLGDKSELSDGGGVLIFRAIATPALTADRVASNCTQPNGTPIGCLKLYRYEEATGALECLDCAPGLGELSSHVSFTDSARLSADGSTVAFTTPEALLTADVNNGNDAYEWRSGALRLITDGRSSFPEQAYAAPHIAAVDASGEDIFFTVDAPSLTGFEHSGFANAYDARIGGGFARPTAEPQCSEESCQGPLIPAPAAGHPTSSTFAGPGNPGKGKPRCAKGKVRRKGRCVSRHGHKRQGHHHRKPGHGRARTKQRGQG